MAISISVCNLALGELRAPPIADIGEESTEAAECGRYYPQCLKLLLERYEWSFATKVATLAALATNERDNEWGYAYATPDDLATPKRIVPDTGGSLHTLHGYIVEGGILYTDVSDAVLEYSSDDVSEAVMPSLFIDALAYSLASRLAVPIRDSRELKGELLKQAEIAAQRAIADDMNRQPQRQEAHWDEVSDARGGWRSDMCFPFVRRMLAPTLPGLPSITPTPSPTPTPTPTPTPGYAISSGAIVALCL